MDSERNRALTGHSNQPILENLEKLRRVKSPEEVIVQIDVAASLLASHPHIADCIISHRLPLDAAAEAFAIAANRRAGAIKVVLQP